MALEVGVELVRQRADVLVHDHAHVLDVVPDLLVLHLDLREELLGNALQRVLRPLGEPVDGAAVHQGGEHPQPGPERVPHGAHADDGVQVLPALLDEEVVQLGGGLVPPDLLGPRADQLHDVHQLVLREEVRHLAGVEDVVEVLEEALVLDLRVVEQEHRLLVLPAALPQNRPEVLPPLRDPVALRDLDREETVLGHERGDLRQALPPAAPDPHQQPVPVRLLDHAADPADVLRGIEEQHQVHLVLRVRVVVPEVLLDRLEQLLLVGDLHVLGVLGAGDEEVPVHQPPQLQNVDHPVVVEVVCGEHVVEVHAERGVDHGLRVGEEPFPVRVADQAVVEHA